MKLLLSNPNFKASFKLEHQHQLFFIGSCFAESISRYFVERKFRTQQNPCGILYNAVSISNSIQHIIQQKTYERSTFYEHEGLFSSWDHHSSFSEPDWEVLKEKLEALNKIQHAYLKQTDIAFITLGTAWVYWHKELEKIVANNLKAPSHFFEKRLLGIDEIYSSLKEVVTNLKALNKNVRIVFTVSPVRHSKEGLVENNRSKARLIEAIHEISQEESTVYFPSYEIVMDVLRDYRFFEKDLVHPTQQATDYVWSFLSENFINPEALPLLEEIYKIRLATQHRLKNKESISAQAFIKTQLDKINHLEALHPHLDMNKERTYFEKLYSLKT